MTSNPANRSNIDKEAALNTDHSITDEELVALARSAGEGDLRPFDQLVRRHRGKVLANQTLLAETAIVRRL